MPDIFDKIAKLKNNSSNESDNVDIFDKIESKKKPDSGKYFLKGVLKSASRAPAFLQKYATPQAFAEPLMQALGVQPRENGIVNKESFKPFEEKVSSFLEKKAPYSEEMRPWEEYGERYAPQALTNPLLAFVSAGAGQLTKEAGGGPGLQALAEIGSFSIAQIGKALISKAVIPSKGLKDLYNFGKSMGMSESEITPLMQSKGKIKWLSRLSSKGEKTKGALASTKEALGGIVDKLKSQFGGKKILTAPQANKFANAVKNVTKELPVEMRELVQKDAFELAKNGFSGEELMNFWKDLNYHISRGNRQLGLLKGPITEALKDINPKLADSFIKTNNLYSRYYNISKALKPTIYNELEKGGKTYLAVKDLLTFNFKGLAGLGLYEGAKKTAENLLINPRYQSLTKKFISALNTRKMNQANILFQEMNKMIKKESPEMGDVFDKIDFNQLKEKKD